MAASRILVVSSLGCDETEYLLSYRRIGAYVGVTTALAAILILLVLVWLGTPTGRGR